MFQTVANTGKRNGHHGQYTSHRHHHHHHQQQPKILTRSQEELIRYVYESKLFTSASALFQGHPSDVRRNLFPYHMGTVKGGVCLPGTLPLCYHGKYESIFKRKVIFVSPHVILYIWYFSFYLKYKIVVLFCCRMAASEPRVENGRCANNINRRFFANFILLATHIFLVKLLFKIILLCVLFSASSVTYYQDANPNPALQGK